MRACEGERGVRAARAVQLQRAREQSKATSERAHAAGETSRKRNGRVAAAACTGHSTTTTRLSLSFASQTTPAVQWRRSRSWSRSGGLREFYEGLGPGAAVFPCARATQTPCPVCLDIIISGARRHQPAASRQAGPNSTAERERAHYHYCCSFVSATPVCALHSALACVCAGVVSYRHRC